MAGGRVIEVSTGKIPSVEVEYFESMNHGWKCTGETLKESWVDRYGLEYNTEYVVFKGKFTQYGMCRDCGDHYIIARWDRYDKIDKKTHEYTYDVEDI